MEKPKLAKDKTGIGTNGYSPAVNKFRLEIRRFLIIRAIKISNSLPIGIVKAKNIITLKMKHNQFMKDFV